VNPAERGQLVAALLRVPGVSGARVEPDGPGPGTLRLDLVAGADEVLVASEVNALLRDRFGLSVDPNGVRVLGGGTPAADPPMESPDAPEVEGTQATAASQPPDAARSAAQPSAAEPRHGTSSSVREPDPDPQRLSIDRLRLSSAGLVTTVIVTLSRHGQSYEGSAEGTATAESLNRAVATATLHAVEAVAAGAVRFELEHVEIAHTPGEHTALAVVTMVTERVTQRLTGASVVREDVRQAVIRAVLAAVNRQVPTVLPEPSA
jgi:hypothetical protein